MQQPLQYRSFLLTAWQERIKDAVHDSVWRFSLEDVRSESKRRIFTNLEEVMRHIENELEDRQQ